MKNTRMEHTNHYGSKESDLIVRSNGFYCNLHHDIEDIAAEISVCNRLGQYESYLVPVAYCHTCNVCFILDETYRELKKHGLIMCQIMTYKDYKVDGAYNEAIGHWRTQSPLKLWGYSVSQNDGYSDYQRRAILEDIIDCGVMTKDRVLSYLDFFIGLGNSRGNIALTKWQDDRKYIAGYEIGSKKKIKVGNIVIIDKS